MYIPRIAIIGGGPSGLLLARLLKCQKVPSTVYELEETPEARTQGGSLDIHQGSGQDALRDAGLLDQFLALARPEGEVLRIFDENENLRMDEAKSMGARPIEMHNRPEIDRPLLRKLLLNSLDNHAVQWGHKSESIRPVDDHFELHFRSSPPEVADVVIGADGAWSKVRALVTDEKPQFSGVNGAEINLLNVDQQHPTLSERVGNGMCLTLGPNKGILAQRSGSQSIQAYAFLRAAEDWHMTSGIDWDRPMSAKKQLVDKEFSGWSSSAQSIVLNSDLPLVPRPLYMLPIGSRWKHRRSVTLIGDAAHLMPPFAGVGVNVAMMDALFLSRSLIQNRHLWKDRHSCLDSIFESIKEYEHQMFTRAKDNAEQTAMFQELFFNSRGASAMMEYFEKANRERGT